MYIVHVLVLHSFDISTINKNEMIVLVVMRSFHHLMFLSCIQFITIDSHDNSGGGLYPVRVTLRHSPL